MDRNVVPTEEDIDVWLDTLPGAEQKARSRGLFFTDMEGFWDMNACAIQNDWYDAIVRTRDQGAALYPETVDPKNLKNELYNGDASDATDTVQTRTTKVDSFRNMGSEKAHCLSHVPLCSKTLGRVAEAGTGCVNCGSETRRKLMNGVKTGNDKIRRTGLKHHRFNKFYLERQKEEFDSSPPTLAIFPIMDVDRVLGWNGVDDYDVIAITFGNTRQCHRNVLKDAFELGTVYDNKEEVIERCRELAETFIKALSASLVRFRVEENVSPREGLTYLPMQRWRSLLNKIRTQQTCHVPSQKAGINWDEINIACGKASRQFSLPDPFCLVVKGAINLSHHLNQGFPLYPSCPPPPSCGSSSDDDMNTSQQDGENDFRDYANALSNHRTEDAVNASLSNPSRQTVELFCIDS